MTRPPLPAHRFEQRKKNDDGRTWVFDFDATITAAPKQLSRIATGLKAQGDHIIVLTGNVSPAGEIKKQLADFGFPYDDLVQYHDDDTDGIARSQHLKQFDAWGAFDNRIDRAPIFATVCPHLYVIAPPTDDDEAAAKANKTKKQAKKAAKKLTRSEDGNPEVRGNDSPEDAA